MTPTIVSVLTRIAALQSEPDARDDPYIHAQLQRAPLLMTAAAEVLDTETAWRLKEWGALQALLFAARKVVDDASLSTRLDRALAGKHPGDRVSALSAAIRTQRELLVSVHAWSEQTRSPAARKVNADIWKILREGTERRRSPIDRF